MIAIPPLWPRAALVACFEELKAAGGMNDQVVAILSADFKALSEAKDHQVETLETLRHSIRVNFLTVGFAIRGRIDGRLIEAFERFEQHLANGGTALVGSAESDPESRADMTKPGLALLTKLASIAVHVVEMRSTDGHHFDAAALDALLADPEVDGWLKQMGDAALAPLVRRDAPAPSPEI